MTTKPPSPIFVENSQGLFYQALGSLANALQTGFLPHLLWGLGLFLLTTYTSYFFLFRSFQFPSAIENFLLIVFFLICGFAALFYGILLATAAAFYRISSDLEDFIEGVFDLVKSAVNAKIETMTDGIAKEQAKVVVRDSVGEVMQLFRSYDMRSFPRWLALVFLGGLTFVLRSVLVARIVKVAGTTVNFGKLFAGRATLLGAVFLNLKLFSLLFLWLLYVLGGSVLLFNLIFVFLWK